MTIIFSFLPQGTDILIAVTTHDTWGRKTVLCEIRGTFDSPNKGFFTLNLVHRPVLTLHFHVNGLVVPLS
jgi:hypothetical protein